MVLKLFHQLFLKEIDFSNAEKYRYENVFISGAKYVPPMYINVPHEMQKLIVKYQGWKDLHPIVRACYLQREFVKIHPFIDGNGRTARLLFIQSGYLPVVIKSENRAENYDALDKAHTTNDYTEFIKIIVDLVNESEDTYLYLTN